jgi:hypothetical protein
MAKLGEHAAGDAAMQPKAALGQGVLVGGDGFLDLQVGGDEVQVPVIAGFDEGVSVAVDGGVQHCAAELVAIRAEVSAAAGETQPQWHARAYRFLPEPHRPLLIS